MKPRLHATDRNCLNYWQHCVATCCMLLISAIALAETHTSLPADTPHIQALTTRLEKIEILLEHSSDYPRYILLDSAGRAAVELALYDKAENFANTLLELAPRYVQDWNYASALHYGRIILGRVALHKGDLDSAKRYLIAAGKVPVSEVLDHNGPDLVLANDLLAHGETTAVKNYLESCRDIWPGGLDKLDHWLKVLGDGKTPRLLDE